MKHPYIQIYTYVSLTSEKCIELPDHLTQSSAPNVGTSWVGLSWQCSSNKLREQRNMGLSWWITGWQWLIRVRMSGTGWKPGPLNYHWRSMFKRWYGWLWKLTDFWRRMSDLYGLTQMKSKASGKIRWLMVTPWRVHPVLSGEVLNIRGWDGDHIHNHRLWIIHHQPWNQQWLIVVNGD